jgi:hypothetical protein
MLLHPYSDASTSLMHTRRPDAPTHASGSEPRKVIIAFEV